MLVFGSISSRKRKARYFTLKTLSEGCIFLDDFQPLVFASWNIGHWNIFSESISFCKDTSIPYSVYSVGSPKRYMKHVKQWVTAPLETPCEAIHFGIIWWRSPGEGVYEAIWYGFGCRAAWESSPSEWATKKLSWKWLELQTVMCWIYVKKKHIWATKNPGCLGYIGDYTTQLYRDYNKPL